MAENVDENEAVLLQAMSVEENITSDYKAYTGEVREWLRCAFYLGMLFSKTTYDHLAYYLGVE